MNHVELKKQTLVFEHLSQPEALSREILPKLWFVRFKVEFIQDAQYSINAHKLYVPNPNVICILFIDSKVIGEHLH